MHISTHKKESGFPLVPGKETKQLTTSINTVFVNGFKVLEQVDLKLLDSHKAQSWN